MAELELMKERFAKLLLGEDMSGGGKGVCTAVTISNSITNLYGNSFFMVNFLRLRESDSTVFLVLVSQSGFGIPYMQLLYLVKI